MDQEQISGSDANLNVEKPDEFQILVDFPDMPLAASELDVDDADVEFGLMETMARGASAADQITQRSQSAIEAAMATIQEMALQTDIMRKGIPGGSQPRMIKVKFGISLDFEVGALLARSGVGATMEVELEWARRSDDVLRVLRAETDVEQVLFREAERRDDA